MGSLDTNPTANSAFGDGATSDFQPLNPDDVVLEKLLLIKQAATKEVIVCTIF